MIVSEEIVRLHELHRRGILTDAEFTQAKARLLAEPEQRADAVHWLGLWRRSRSDCWLGGVCGGLGQLSGVASWIWRLAFLLFGLSFGIGVLFYILLWICVPQSEIGD